MCEFSAKNIILVLILIFLILCALILAKTLLNDTTIMLTNVKDKNFPIKNTIKEQQFTGGKQYIIKGKYPILLNKNMLCSRAVSKRQLVSIYNKWRNENQTIIKFDNVKIPKYAGTFDNSFGGNQLLMLVDHDPARDKNSILIDDYGILTNYFIEKARLLCENNHFSLLDAYNTVIKKEKLTGATGLHKYLAMRDKIAINTHLCETFPSSVALGLMRIFKPRRILDMSAGWGDRMVAAIAYRADHYVGVDPNTALVDGYRKMAETYTDKSILTVSGQSQTSDRYSLILSPFETASNDIILEHSRGQLFDMMISCPPYFNAEQYSVDTGQSYVNYKTIDSWVDNFMKYSVDKSWALMCDNSTYIICINDVFIGGVLNKYTENILQYIASKPGAKYVGMLKYRHYNYIVPIWIFHKCENINSGPYLREYQMVSPYDEMVVQHARNCWSNGEKLQLHLHDNISGEDLQNGMPTNNISVIGALIYGTILVEKKE